MSRLFNAIGSSVTCRADIKPRPSCFRQCHVRQQSIPEWATGRAEAALPLRSDKRHGRYYQVPVPLMAKCREDECFCPISFPSVQRGSFVWSSRYIFLKETPDDHIHPSIQAIYFHHQRCSPKKDHPVCVPVRDRSVIC